MGVSDSRTGLARVWLGPEPDRGAHSSIVGVVTVTALGVLVPPDAMSMLVDLDDRFPDEDWPRGDWLPWSEYGTSSLIPWHRVRHAEDALDRLVHTVMPVDTVIASDAEPPA